MEAASTSFFIVIPLCKLRRRRARMVHRTADEASKSLIKIYPDSGSKTVTSLLQLRAMFCKYTEAGI
jgi:hypothetical protein